LAEIPDPMISATPPAIIIKIDDAAGMPVEYAGNT
jgi:hypothetical protein